MKDLHWLKIPEHISIIFKFWSQSTDKDYILVNGKFTVLNVHLMRLNYKFKQKY